LQTGTQKNPAEPVKQGLLPSLQNFSRHSALQPYDAIHPNRPVSMVQFAIAPLYCFFVVVKGFAT
jgi:hypothetical protein